MTLCNVTCVFSATFASRLHSQLRDLRERRRDKKTYTWREEETARAECHERMEKGQKSQRELDPRGDTYVCVCVRVCTVWFRDALSNVLFISVEQSLPVYPEDISLVALCTQRYDASQSRELHLKRRLSAVASRPRRSWCSRGAYILITNVLFNHPLFRK